MHAEMWPRARTICRRSPMSSLPATCGAVNRWWYGRLPKGGRLPPRSTSTCRKSDPTLTGGARMRLTLIGAPPVRVGLPFALFRLVAKRHLRLFVHHQGTHEAERRTRTRHIDGDGQHAGHALLQIQHIRGCLLVLG